MQTPCSRTILPSTETRPPAISPSQARREPNPQEARYLCRRGCLSDLRFCFGESKAAVSLFPFSTRAEKVNPLKTFHHIALGRNFIGRFQTGMLCHNPISPYLIHCDLARLIAIGAGKVNDKMDVLISLTMDRFIPYIIHVTRISSVISMHISGMQCTACGQRFD